jgi:hypothetical protein
MTPGQRIRQIQSEERERTVDAIAALDADEQVREDIARVFAVVQQAVNAFVGAEDRILDARIVPTALGLTIDELERVYKRLSDEGLTP